MSVLSVQAVARWYGEREVLKDVSFRVGYGDRVGLVGPNGLVSDFNEAQYVNAANSVEGFAADQMRTRQRTREVAERLFDLRQIGAQQYARLYENVMAAMNQT